MSNPNCLWLRNGNEPCVPVTGQRCVPCREFYRVTEETITDAHIMILLREAESTTPVSGFWPVFVDAVSEEWSEEDPGGRAHNLERAEARAKCVEIWNKRL